MAFASRQPSATIFHHPAWIETVTKTYHYVPLAATLTGENGAIVAGLPILKMQSWITGERLISLPFSDFCPPLVTGGMATDDLLHSLTAWRSEQHLPEIEIRWPLEPRSGIYPGETFTWHNTRLESDSELVFRRFKKTQVQQCIRQAEKAGVTVQQGERWEDVLAFYRLHLQTRRRLGTPIQPLHYFRSLWERLIAQKLGFVLLAYKDSQILAGSVFLHWNKTLTYKYSASDPASWSLRPNNLILWHAIRWGCEQGYEVFDWGKTDLEDVGLRDFKRGWGSEEQTMHYSILADRKPAAKISSGRIRRILKTVIQKSPPWVCRMMGELFYGHFA